MDADMMPFWMRDEPKPEGVWYCHHCGTTEQPHIRLQPHPDAGKKNRPLAVMYAVCKQCLYVYEVDLSNHLSPKMRNMTIEQRLDSLLADINSSTESSGT